jgi:ElaB/YqjD/DUF883 family membrane-anchored ribosome-binding protein
MNTKVHPEQAPGGVTQVAPLSDQANSQVSHTANNMLDGVSNKLQELGHSAGPMISRATEQAGALAHRGIDAVRDGSQQLQHDAREASDRTLAYVKNEPIKAMLIAAATGAALMALVTLVTHARART